MKKKIVALIMVIILSLGLMACGVKSISADDKKDPTKPPLAYDDKKKDPTKPPLA